MVLLPCGLPHKYHGADQRRGISTPASTAAIISGAGDTLAKIDRSQRSRMIQLG
jgi:hypothetical protein